MNWVGNMGSDVQYRCARAAEYGCTILIDIGSGGIYSNDLDEMTGELATAQYLFQKEGKR